MKIRFAGAAQTVTGSRTVLDHGGYHFMIDCGLYQGPKPLRLMNWEQPQDFKAIQAIIVTHAHIDHSGLLPRWASWGWNGPIYCTIATADLLGIMLPDAARLQEEDARYANKTRHSRHNPALPLYTELDAQTALRQLRPLPFLEWQDLNPELRFRFLPAGHILGSAIVQIEKREPNGSLVVTFSGDLGGGHSDLLTEPQGQISTDYLVLESTYGSRRVLSEGREDRLAEVVNKVINRGGTLVVPVFALGRAQDLLLSLYQLKQTQHIPDVPIYLDSPMANAVTQSYLKNKVELQPELKATGLLKALSDQQFIGIESPEESMLLCQASEPKIVLSASGMLQGGRILHHLKNKLSHQNNGVLFVGYQSEGSKGRLLQEGIDSLRIHHEEVLVRAEIFTLDGYSAHGDSEDILNWLRQFQKFPRKVFLNHGEYEAQSALAQKIQAEFATEVVIPHLHDEFELS